MVENICTKMSTLRRLRGRGRPGDEEQEANFNTRELALIRGLAVSAGLTQ